MLLLYHSCDSFRRWWQFNLHSTMLLLYPALRIASKVWSLNLHSTMLLLYPDPLAAAPQRCHSFTFHYASTLSGIDCGMEWIIHNLHSTMLLLYRLYGSAGTSAENTIYIPLCFYFISPPLRLPQRLRLIYIPLCFYFILSVPSVILTGYIFTFHYASTLSNHL